MFKHINQELKSSLDQDNNLETNLNNTTLSQGNVEMTTDQDETMFLDETQQASSAHNISANIT